MKTKPIAQVIGSVALVLVTLFLLSQRLARRVTIIPTAEQIKPLTTPSPCIQETFGEWRTIAGHRVNNIRNPIEARRVVKQLYPEHPEWKTYVHVLRYPDDPEIELIEYDIVVRGIRTVLLTRKGEEWRELPELPYESSPWIEIVDVDLIGFVWECVGWSLYATARNTEYQSTVQLPAFYQSRDNGLSWSRLSSYGFRNRQIPSPPVSPPKNAELSAEWYDEDQGNLHVFAWSGWDRNLYTLPYPVTPTPTP